MSQSYHWAIRSLGLEHGLAGDHVLSPCILVWRSDLPLPVTGEHTRLAILVMESLFFISALCMFLSLSLYHSLIHNAYHIRNACIRVGTYTTTVFAHPAKKAGFSPSNALQPREPIQANSCIAFGMKKNSSHISDDIPNKTHERQNIQWPSWNFTSTSNRGKKKEDKK